MNTVAGNNSYAIHIAVHIVQLQNSNNFLHLVVEKDFDKEWWQISVCLLNTLYLLSGRFELDNYSKS